jgi:hypothetical protein
MSIEFLILKMSEIDKLKKVLLDEDQLYVFNCLPNLTMGQHLESLKRKTLDDQGQIFNDDRSNDPIFKRLVDLVEENK